MSQIKRTVLASIVATAVIVGPVVLLRTGYAAETTVVDDDGDGLSNTTELTVWQTDSKNSDSDGDGYADGLEIANGYSPHVTGKTLRESDQDGDGLWDDWEVVLGTNLFEKDSDRDGHDDGLEVTNGYDPLTPGGEKLAKSIRVSLKNQRLSYFFGGRELDSFLISSGLASTPTPRGTFTILKKRPIVHYAGVGFDYPNTRWNLMFKRGSWGNYYIHGAWWHNDFGTPKSHGCVNVPHTYETMGRLYDWADTATVITIE